MLAASDRTGREHVSLQLKWTHAFQFAGFYAAVEKGFYREAGLDVSIFEAVPGVDPVRNVVEGKAQYGVGTSSLLLERAAGKPVVALAVIFQHSPYVLIARQDTPTQGIHDLVDKRIMLEPQSDEIIAYLRSEHIPLDRLTRLEHSYDPQDLITGRVDAIAGYVTNQPYYLDRARIPYQIYTPRSGGIDFYGDNLFTTEQELRNHPDRVRAFRSASLRGWQYAMAHPEEIADLIIARYSHRHTRDYYLFEARQMVPLLRPELIEAGYMYPGRWQHIAQVYEDLGMLRRDFSLDGFLYNATLPPADLGWLYFSLAAALLLALIVGLIAARFSRLSRKLRVLVAEHRAAQETMARAKLAAEAATSAKENFLAHLSHELRTPLTPVLLATSQWQRSTDIPDTLRNDLAMMRRNLDVEARLLDDLLDTNRILHGKLPLRRSEFSLHEAIRQALDTVAAAVQAKQLTITLDLKAEQDRIHADSTRLQQVLWNLLSNAAKFTPNTGHIAIATTNEPAEWIQVSITDNGIGIEPELLGQLFEPFAQAGPHISRDYGGLGLGLSICRSMVEAHGGSIGATSEGRGHGSTFVLRLPLRGAVLNEEPVSPPPVPLHFSPAAQRVLLVDDDNDTVEIVSRMLREAGYSVRTANSVASAFAELDRNTFDLLLTDLSLPDGTAYELLRRQPSENTAPKAIALSGSGAAKDLQRSREHGFAAHLVKPVSLHLLLATIADVLAQADLSGGPRR